MPLSTSISEFSRAVLYLSADKINLKGIMVGNGCLGNNVGVCGGEVYGEYLSIAQLHGHGFISDLAFNKMTDACGDWVSPDLKCRLAIDAANAEAGSDFDIYDLYAATYGTCGYGARKGGRPGRRGAGTAPRRPLAEGSVDLARHEVGNSCVLRASTCPLPRSTSPLPSADAPTMPTSRPI